MKTIITQRNFKPLYHFLIILSLFLLIRQYFVVKISDIAKINSQLYLTNVELGKLGHPELQQSYDSLFIQIRSFEEYFGVAIVLISCVIFYFISTYLKSIKAKFIAFLMELCLVWVVFSMTTSELRLNAHDDDKYFISLLVFLPFLFFIYHNSLIGNKVDISSEIKGKAERLHNEDLNDLDNLFKLNLISKEEYNKKKDSRRKDKIIVELKDSDEYNLLVKSKQKGLLTDDEFKMKFENLVNNEYKKTL